MSDIKIIMVIFSKPQWPMYTKSESRHKVVDVCPAVIMVMSSGGIN
jgi:hypothetical protein